MSRAAVIALTLVAIGVLIFIFARMGPETKPIVVDDPRATEAASRPSAPLAPIPSTPFAEAGTASSSTRPLDLEIEVIGPKGTPAADARLVIHRGEEILAAGRTDGRGVGRFAAGTGEAEVVVRPIGSSTHAETVSIAPGRRRIQLPAGVAISGRVEVNGAVPGETVPLDFSGDVELDLPWKVWVALQPERRPMTSTGAQGDFELTGLREGSEWRFRAGVGYRTEEVLIGARPTFVIPAPSAGVVIRLKRLPVVRGRAVAEDTGEPLAGCRLEAAQRGQSSAESSYGPISDDGRFELTIGEEPLKADVKVTRLELKIIGPKGIGEKIIVLDPAPEQDRDLGDVPVPVARKVEFVVRDTAGAPIKGAFARVGPDADPSSKTDERGYGAISVGPEAKSFRVGGLKYAATDVTIPEALAGRLPVVLEANAGLEITVSPAVAARWLRVVIASPVDRAVDEDNPLRSDGVYVAAGATENGYGVMNDKMASSEFKPAADGRVVIAGLRTGIPLTLTVIDELAKDHATDTVTLAPGEWKTVALRVAAAARSLRGRVVDPDGQPVSGARVTIDADPDVAGARNWSRGDGRTIAGTTADDGRFVLSGLYDETVHFAANKLGFVPLVRLDFPLPSEGVEVEFKLQRGARLEVRVTDSDGAPLRDLDLQADVPGLPKLLPESKEPGSYVFLDFPTGVPARLSVQWAERHWTREVTIKGDHVERIQMPVMGAVAIDFSALDSRPWDVWLHPAEEGQGDIHRWVPPPAEGAPPDTALTIAPIFPGEYTVRAQTMRATEIAAPQTITVKPGQTTRVILRKP